MMGAVNLLVSESALLKTTGPEIDPKILILKKEQWAKGSVLESQLLEQLKHCLNYGNVFHYTRCHTYHSLFCKHDSLQNLSSPDVLSPIKERTVAPRTELKIYKS